MQASVLALSVVSATSQPETRKWDRRSYAKLVDAGVFQPGERVELIEGEILQMSPEKSRHAAVIDLVNETLRAAFGPGFVIRIQHPLAVDARSEPEPDLAVVPGGPRDFLDAHPSSAMLVVEVADTSLSFDRETKSRIYAQAQIPAYWIVNLRDDVVEVFEQPASGRYLRYSTLDQGELTLTTGTAGRAVTVALADLLP